MTNTIQTQHAALLNQLDQLIQQAKAEDQSQADFFTAIRQFISLDQDNPMVHSFLYEFERKLIAFANQDFGARINIDLFEDEEGKNLFHHIAINVNMLFEELGDSIVSVDQLQAVLDMFDGYGLIANSEGKLIRFNQSLQSVLDPDQYFGLNSPVGDFIPQFGTYLYKAALITGEIMDEPVQFKLNGALQNGKMKMKHVMGGGEQTAVFVILITPNS